MKVKELDGISPDFTEVGQEKSDSTDQWHSVQWSEKQGYRCDCSGWLSSRSKPKTCKHIKRFCFKTALEHKIFDWVARGFMTVQSDGARLNIIQKTTEIVKEIWGV